MSLEAELGGNLACSRGISPAVIEVMVRLRETKKRRLIGLTEGRGCMWSGTAEND